MVKLCDNCLRAMTYNLNQTEVVLLQKMNELNIKTPHLSIDETKMITLVKGLSPYKIKYVIQRFQAIGLIDSVKHGCTKYYLNDNGIQLIKLYVIDNKKYMKK